jgi:hypothetical protein
MTISEEAVRRREIGALGPHEENSLPLEVVIYDIPLDKRTTR